MLVCMEFFTLNGAQVSRIGLGTWAIGGSEWGAVPEADAIATCLAIFDHGINLIDTAPIYGFGRSEQLIGKAIRQHGACGHWLDTYINYASYASPVTPAIFHEAAGLFLHRHRGRPRMERSRRLLQL